MGSKEDLRNFQLQLDQVNDGLSLAPDDKELLDLKSELTDLITLLSDQLQAEQAEQELKDRKWLEKAAIKAAMKAQAPTKPAAPVSPNGEDTLPATEPRTNEKPEYV